MTKQELYLAIYQATGQQDGLAPLRKVFDFHRDVAVHKAKNSNGNTSYITLEFSGLRSRYLCSILFDGSGELGVSVLNFAMPKVRLNHLQKALVLLACVEFLCGHFVLQPENLEFYRQGISSEYGNGQTDLLIQFDQIKQVAANYLNANKDSGWAETASWKPAFQHYVI